MKRNRHDRRLHIVVARKPVEGTVADNCLVYGTGALNIDGCRIGTETVTTHSRGMNEAFPKRPTEKSAEESGRKQDQRLGLDLDTERAGRWPANLVLDKYAAVFFPDTVSVGHNPKQRGKGGLSTSGHSGQDDLIERHLDSGNSSRFFFNFAEQESDE